MLCCFPWATSAPLHPYPQGEQSAAPVAKVGLLATAAFLSITYAPRWYLNMWLVERLVAGLFVVALPLPPLSCSWSLASGALVLGTCPPLAAVVVKQSSTTQSAYVPVRVWGTAMHRCQCVCPCQHSFMIALVQEAPALVYPSGVGLPLHFAMFIPVAAPGYALSSCW